MKSRDQIICGILESQAQLIIDEKLKVDQIQPKIFEYKTQSGEKLYSFLISVFKKIPNPTDQQKQYFVEQFLKIYPLNQKDGYQNKFGDFLFASEHSPYLTLAVSYLNSQFFQSKIFNVLAIDEKVIDNFLLENFLALDFSQEKLLGFIGAESEGKITDKFAIVLHQILLHLIACDADKTLKIDQPSLAKLKTACQNFDEINLVLKTAASLTEKYLTDDTGKKISYLDELEAQEKDLGIENEPIDHAIFTKKINGREDLDALKKATESVKQRGILAMEKLTTKLESQKPANLLRTSSANSLSDQNHGQQPPSENRH
ncbi:MAG: hypothetical protein V4612_03445 [Pseudomonadota bacterium]